MPWVSFLIYCSAFYELAIIEAFFVPLRINFENFEIQNIWMFSGDNNGFNTSENRLIDNCLMYTYWKFIRHPGVHAIFTQLKKIVTSLRR